MYTVCSKQAPYRLDSDASVLSQVKDTAFREATFVVGGMVRYGGGNTQAVPVNCRYLQRMFGVGDHDFSLAVVSSGGAAPVPRKAESQTAETDAPADDAAQQLAVSDQSDLSDLLETLRFDAYFCDDDFSLPEEKWAKTSSQKRSLFNRSSKDYLIVDVNGIRIAFIRPQSKKTVQTAVREVKEKGAEFITWICSRALAGELGVDIASVSEKNQDGFIQQLERAVGALPDLIIFDSPLGQTGSYIRVKDSAGKSVRVFCGVGVMHSTALTTEDLSSSLAVRVALNREFSGKVNIRVSYIPICSEYNRECRYLVPTTSQYGSGYRVKSLAKVNARYKGLGASIRPFFENHSVRLSKSVLKQLTLREVFEALDVDPSFYTGDFPLDELVPSICCSEKRSVEHCVAINPAISELPLFSYEAACACNASVFIEAKSKITQEMLEGPVPCLPVDDAREILVPLCNAIKDRYGTFTVGVTGSNGKTTTVAMIKSVATLAGRTLNLRGNANAPSSTSAAVQLLNSSYRSYIQEVSGRSVGTASVLSRMIQPDAAVVTSIAHVHLDSLGSIEGVCEQKLRIADGLRPGGKLYLNNDNEYLKAAHPDCDVVRYAANDTEADYYAQNIVQHVDRITFQIVAPDGVFDAVIFCFGEVNVSNAVCAFAIGRQMGIPPYKIVAGLSRFRPEGIRQTVYETQGVTVFLDCFNASPETTRLSLHTLRTMADSAGGRAIAVLGDIEELGAESEALHVKIGESVAEEKADVLIALGEKSAAMANRAAELGIEAYQFADREAFEAKITEVMRPGDILLFKASNATDLAQSAKRIFPDLA